jgi:hypothetical protein
MNEKLEYSELIPESDYEKLLLSGVMCSDCGEKLSDTEIKMHRFVGIIEPTEMCCQKCWMKIDYGDMLISMI